MTPRAAALVLVSFAAAAAACLSTQKPPVVTYPGLDASIDAGAVACRPCLSSADCLGQGACLQYAGNDYCARTCNLGTECAKDEQCLLATALDGTQVQVCIPTTGMCGESGCGTCPESTFCEWTIGMCLPLPDGGLPAHCGALVAPALSACCHSCTAGTANCATNGCYGGWWCDTNLCRCAPAPLSCPSADAGIPQDDAGPPIGTVTAQGGSVSRLYFAVVGDTRPGHVDDTQGYPTQIITKIFQDVQAMDPRPQFVLATGDFMFATPAGKEAAPQMQAYATAAKAFGGPLFPSMGNHECDGYTADNCLSPTSNLTAFTDALLTPIGQTNPYFTIPFQALDGSWTAKLVVLGCNAWTGTQKAWFETEMARPSTFTIVARHEPSSASNAPCVLTTDKVLATAKYDLLLVGHTHAFASQDKQIIVGISGAPLSGPGNYGYAIVEQLATGFVIREHDWATGLAVNATFVPF
jgi:hypothetical protein